MMFLPFNPRTDSEDSPSYRAIQALLASDLENMRRHDTRGRSRINVRGLRFCLLNNLDTDAINEINGLLPGLVLRFSDARCEVFGDNIVQCDVVSPESLAVLQREASRMDTVISIGRIFTPGLSEVVLPILSSQGGLGRLIIKDNNHFAEYAFHRIPFNWPSVTLRPNVNYPEATQVFFGQRPVWPNADGRRGARLNWENSGEAVSVNNSGYGFFTTLTEFDNGTFPEDARGEVMYTFTYGKAHPLCYRLFHPFKALYWLDGGYMERYDRLAMDETVARQIVNVLMLSEMEYFATCAALTTALDAEGRLEFARSASTHLIGDVSRVQRDTESRRRQLDDYARQWETALRQYREIASRLDFMLRNVIAPAEAQAALLSDLDGLLQLGTVESVHYTPTGRLHVYTNDLVCHSDHSGEMVWKRIGKVKIIINPLARDEDNSYKVQLWNQTVSEPGPYGRGSCHDYYPGGGTCWGDAGRTVEELLSTGDICDLIVFIINFIESPPASDGYRRFNAFPTIDPPS